MDEFSLSENQCEIFRLAFWMSPFALFFLIFIQMSFAIAEIFITGFLPDSNGDPWLFYAGLPPFFTFLLCVLTMWFYSILYLCHLWRTGERKKCMATIPAIVLFNALAGYLCFYQGEIKKEKIQLWNWFIP